MSSTTAVRDLHTVFWRALLWPGMERCTLAHTEDDQHVIEGTAIVLSDDTPFELRYQIWARAQWQTRRVQVDVVSGDDLVQRLVMEANDGHRWQINNAVMVNLDGCVDIDLGFSPATNMLPIRRLALEVGEATSVRAAWLKFPELTMEPLDQRYTRLSDTTYLYESTSGRSRRIVLDANGMLVSYEDGWERLSSS